MYQVRCALCFLRRCTNHLEFEQAGVRMICTSNYGRFVETFCFKGLGEKHIRISGFIGVKVVEGITDIQLSDERVSHSDL